MAVRFRFVVLLGSIRVILIFFYPSLATMLSTFVYLLFITILVGRVAASGVTQVVTTIAPGTT